MYCIAVLIHLQRHSLRKTVQTFFCNGCTDLRSYLVHTLINTAFAVCLVKLVLVSKQM